MTRKGQFHRNKQVFISSVNLDFSGKRFRVNSIRPGVNEERMDPDQMEIRRVPNRRKLGL